MSAGVLIVGAGPAGIRAAEVLVEAGLRPTLVDEGDWGGGQIYRLPPEGRRPPYRRLYGAQADAAEALHTTFRRLLPAIDYRPRTLCWNVAGEGLDVLHRDSGQTARLPFTHLILATGAIDRVLPVPGWTLPGVFSLGGAQIALKSQGCLVGRRVCFAGTGPLLYLVALQYAKAGAEIPAIVESSPLARQARFAPGLRHQPATALRGLWFLAALRARGIPILSDAAPLAIEGTDGVASLRIRHPGGERSFACDAVAIGYGLSSECQLAELAGARPIYDPGQDHWVPQAGIDGRTSRPGLYVAGDGAGIQGGPAAELRGALAALSLLEDVGRPVDRARAQGLAAEIGRWGRFRQAIEAMFPLPLHWIPNLSDDVVVCRCENVTAGDVRRAVTRMGAEDANRAKSFSRAGMGRCQGRYCGDNVRAIVAAARGLPADAVGPQRSQPPIKPIPMKDWLSLPAEAAPLETEAGS